MSVFRSHNTDSVTIANGANASSVLEIGEYSMGVFHVPAAFDGTGMNYQLSTTRDGTYLTVYDQGNVAIATTIAVSRAYQIPPEVMNGRFLRLYATTAQTASRTINVDLKG